MKWPRWFQTFMHRRHLRCADWHIDQAAAWLGHREISNTAFRRWVEQVFKKWRSHE